jgi:hypothetical protein
MVHKSSAADSWTRRMTALPRSFQDMGRAATKPLWARDVVLDLAKAACAALLFVSPWMLAFTSAPAWNLWIVGYLMLTCCLAELLAEADWEAQTNFCLGAWVLCERGLARSRRWRQLYFHPVRGRAVVRQAQSSVAVRTEQCPPRRLPAFDRGAPRAA